MRPAAVPNNVRKTAFALALGCLVGAGCADETGGTGSADFAYNNILFSGTKQIVQPVMTAGHAQPAVSWPATDEKHVVCALFAERISVSDQQITNANEIVWLWHTGLGKGREGNVLWENGVPGPEQTAKPKPLGKGTYFWAVWALDEQGLPSWSSEEMVHTVQ